MSSTIATRTLDTLAAGRIAWGVAALAAPRLNTAAVGISDRSTAEVRYLIRVFGSRAIALGIGHFVARGDARVRWGRIGLFVDVCDVLAVLAEYRNIPARAATTLAAATGGYAVVGTAAQLAVHRSRVE